MNNKLNTLKTLLQKERVAYVLKQGIASSIYNWVNSLNYSYFLNHKRNQIGYSGYKTQRDKKTERQIHDEENEHKILKIVVANESQDFKKEDIIEKYSKDVRESDALFVIDVDEARRGIAKNDRLIAYTTLNEFIINFTKYNSFLYNLFRDLFTVFRIVAKNSVFDSDEISVSKDNRYFFVKEMNAKFIHSLNMDKVTNWDKFQSSLHDIYSKEHNIISEPLVSHEPFVRLADDVLLYIRLVTMETYSKLLGKTTLETKKRVQQLEKTIQDLEIEVRNEKIDGEIDEMNDISNSFNGGGENEI